MLFADDTVLVQSENNLEKLQNSVNREMTKVMNWLSANKLSLNVSKQNISPLRSIFFPCVGAHRYVCGDQSRVRLVTALSFTIHNF